jgi:hypothetical protein
MINWIFFPRSFKPPKIAESVVACFERVLPYIDSTKHKHGSDKVLSYMAPELLKIGFRVENGKRKVDKIVVPVLFGAQGKIEKSFQADAYNETEKFVLEIEAGRAFTNNQFLKDLFQASTMNEVEYLAIAVRNVYSSQRDFDLILRFLDTLYASNRLHLPLKGVLLLGY